MVGVIEIGLGLVFCFLDYSAARVVLGLWGAVVGYFAGALLYLLARTQVSEPITWLLQRLQAALRP